MARGRMIDKSLSTSERYASLQHIAGKLGEFCQVLYPLIVIHADDWGCLQGDVFTIKMLCYPTSPRRLTDFETALQALHHAHLITWYQVDGKWYVEVADFARHQDLKGHDKDGRKRPIPPPPENAKDSAFGGKVPPVGENAPLTKEKRTKENLTYTVADATAEAEEAINPDADLSPPPDNREVGAFLKRFCELYSQYRHGAKYHVERRKDVALVKQLLALYGRVRLEKLAAVLLTTDDPWVDETDRGIGILSVKASWLDGRLSAYESKHGTIQVA